MKKFLTLILFLCIVLVVLSEIVLPRVVTNALEDQIMRATAAQSVDLQIDSFPNIKTAFGTVDKIHGTASVGRLGEVDFKELSLDGENISLNMREIFFPSENLSDVERGNKIINYAGKLELHGIITSEDLIAYLEKKVDKLKNAEVKITPDEISASGEVKIMGRTAEVELAGKFVADGGDVYFEMIKFNAKNSLLRHFQIDSWLGEVKVLSGEDLPANLKYDSVEMRDGEILVTAVKSRD